MTAWPFARLSVSRFRYRRWNGRNRGIGIRIYQDIMEARSQEAVPSRRRFKLRPKLMSMKTKAAILVTSFAVLMFVVVGSLGGVHASSNDGSYRQLQVYSEVLSRVRTEYVEEPNIPKVTDGALHGLLESLDSNSAYMSADAYKAFKQRKTESKGGIGAVVSKRFGYAAVVAVLPGSPAEKAGIEQTDIFESIEGQSTREMSLPEIRNLLAGAPGSTLNVSVVRAQGRAAEGFDYPRYGGDSSRGRQDDGRRHRLCEGRGPDQG